MDQMNKEWVLLGNIIENNLCNWDVPEFDVEDRITEELALEERERQKERLLRIIDKKNQSFIKLRDRSFTSDENWYLCTIVRNVDNPRKIWKLTSGADVDNITNTVRIELAIILWSSKIAYDEDSSLLSYLEKLVFIFSHDIQKRTYINWVINRYSELSRINSLKWKSNEEKDRIENMSREFYTEVIDNLDLTDNDLNVICQASWANEHPENQFYYKSRVIFTCIMKLIKYWTR